MRKCWLCLQGNLEHSQGSIYDFLFGGGGGGVDPKTFLEPRSGEKKFVRPSRGSGGGSGGMLPRKILKR